MAIARTFQSLQIYDILANLLPGTMLLIVLITTVQIEEYLGNMSSTLLVAVFLIVGFIIGHIVQAVASQLNGPPRLFGLVVAELRGVEPYNPSGSFEFLPQQMRGWMGLRRSTLSDLSITEVEERFWPIAKEEFDLTEEFEHHGRLMQLVLSYLETVPATRALRFQSVHTFHRSMWGMWYLSVVLVTTVGVASYFNLILSRGSVVLTIMAILSLFGILVFGQRKEKFNEKVVEYAIIDFYTQQKAQ